jgi:hypothetical protein
MNIITKIITAEVLYFLTIICGIWLSHSGKPFNKLILGLHILIGLTTILFTLLAVWELLQTRSLDSGILVIIISLGSLIIGLIGSGIILSFKDEDTSRELFTHNITTILGIIVTTLTIYLLLNNKI